MYINETAEEDRPNAPPPLAGDPAQPWQSYGFSGGVGRLKPGVSAEDGWKDLL